MSRAVTPWPVKGTRLYPICSPHDPRRTAITCALDQGLSYRQVQMKSGNMDPKTVMRYGHGRENLEQNAVNFLRYEEEEGR